MGNKRNEVLSNEHGRMNESDLFNYLKDRYFPDLEKAKDVMSKYDCYSSEYRTVMELKCRRTHYEDLMLERIKYDYLSSLDCRSLYINSTPKGVFSFDIADIKPIWIKDSIMPKNTDFDTSSDRREKEYTLINISKAKRI